MTKIPLLYSDRWGTSWSPLSTRNPRKISRVLSIILSLLLKIKLQMGSRNSTLYCFLMNCWRPSNPFWLITQLKNCYLDCTWWSNLPIRIRFWFNIINELERRKAKTSIICFRSVFNNGGKATNHIIRIIMSFIKNLRTKNC